MDIDREKLYEEIGYKIRSRRRELGLSQNDLAKKVDLTRTSITNIEAGTQGPPLHLLYQLCDSLEIEIFDILPKLNDIVQLDQVEVDGHIEKMPQRTADALRDVLEGKIENDT